MLTLFEVLSFKGWLDVRDILIKSLGPVSRNEILFLKCERGNFSGARHLYPHLHFPGMHDRINVVRWCRNRELFGKQGYCAFNGGSKKMVNNI